MFRSTKLSLLTITLGVCMLAAASRPAAAARPATDADVQAVARALKTVADKGFELQKKGDHAGAVRCFSTILNVLPEANAMRIARANSNAKLGNSVKAAADYTLVILSKKAHSKTKAQAYAGRGLVLYREGLKEKSLADFNSAVVLNPRWAELYLGRAKVNLDLGNTEAARRDYLQYKRLKNGQGGLARHDLRA